MPMNQVIQQLSTSVFLLCRQGFGKDKEQESEQLHITYQIWKRG